MVQTIAVDLKKSHIIGDLQSPKMNFTIETALNDQGRKGNVSRGIASRIPHNKSDIVSAVVTQTALCWLRVKSNAIL